ncbi:hypothetical protein C8J57DRAFT_1305485, partial [Mycena rebaudengoi]
MLVFIVFAQNSQTPSHFVPVYPSSNIMQFKLLIAVVVSCLVLTISAAPIIEEQAARAPLKEEAREPAPGCSLYTCI